MCTLATTKQCNASIGMVYVRVYVQKRTDQSTTPYQMRMSEDARASGDQTSAQEAPTPYAKKTKTKHSLK